MPAYPSASQTSKKRKMNGLGHEGEDDEEAAAHAQAVIAGKDYFLH
jgi:hypothetical protein